MVIAGMETILNDVSKLDNKNLEYFYQQVGQLLSLRKTKSEQKRESILLSIINEPLLPGMAQKKYNLLQEKLAKETISPDEQEELMKLLGQMEKNGIKRLESMIALAGLRKISLDKLLQQLGMTAPFPEHA